VDLHLDIAQQVGETTETYHAVHGVEASAQAAARQYRRVFHDCSAVDFGMTLDRAASSYQG
jgi:hypothetical protein